jgi:hypothetical protein
VCVEIIVSIILLNSKNLIFLFDRLIWQVPDLSFSNIQTYSWLALIYCMS